MKCGGIISCALSIVLLSVVTTTNGELPASLDVETSITTKGDFGVVNKSEGVSILAIFRANQFMISRSLKVIDNLLYVETRGTRFRPVSTINAQEYNVFRSVSSYEGITRFKILGESLPTLRTIASSPTNSTSQLWSSVIHPANPDWEEMKASLDGFGTDISFLQPCTDVPHLCSIQLY